jgi:predicted transport protein
MNNSPFSKLVTEILTHSDQGKTESKYKSYGESLYIKFLIKIKQSCSSIEPANGNLVVVFYKDGKNIFSVEIQSLAIKITINAKYGKLKDPKGLLRDVSKIGHWGSGDYQIKLVNDENFDYLCEIIQQIY